MESNTLFEVMERSRAAAARSEATLPTFSTAKLVAMLTVMILTIAPVAIALAM